jgi:leader peptidase (prepilin peptidase) / N-methyltransferase
MPALPVLLAVLGAILGLAVGSFLNVVIYRVPRGESVVAPASHCPTCDTAIRSRHNVPLISWLLLRARCAYCQAPISARYPIVEALTGAGFAALAAAVGLSPALPVLLYLTAVGITLVLVGWDGQRLPRRFLAPAATIGLVGVAASAALGRDLTVVTGALMLAAACSLGLGISTLIRRHETLTHARL